VGDARVAVSVGDGQVRLGADVNRVEMALDNAVFERVEADGDTESAGTQQPV